MESLQTNVLSSSNKNVKTVKNISFLLDMTDVKNM